MPKLEYQNGGSELIDLIIKCNLDENENENENVVADKYVNIWIEIENILCRNWFTEREFAEYMENDNCEKLTLDACNFPCKLYYSQSKKQKFCYNQDRIKIYGAPLELDSRYCKIHYKFLSTLAYREDIDKQKSEKGISVVIYCHIMSTILNGKNVFIIGFNCGEFELNMNSLYDEDFENYLSSILMQITLLNNSNSYNKMLICGHSMGCMLALRFSLYLYKNHKDFFLKKCICIGSGQTRTIKKNYITDNFTNLPNIKIFISTKIFPELAAPGSDAPEYADFIYYVQHNLDFAHYYPVYSLDGQIIPDQDFMDKKYAPWGRVELHNWKESYYSKLIEQYQCTK